MQKLICALALVLFLAPRISGAKNFLYINHPKKPAYGRHFANIQDASVEIWPAGAYARVELTMTFAASTNYTYLANDSLESVLDFELPEGSFVHNSWLWLNPTVIIQAAILDRVRAEASYNAVVQRNVDPSLLQKTGAEQYQLNVFPVLTSYPRKVRIFYATPFQWSGGAARVALPTQLLSTSQVRPSMQVTVHHDAAFTAPVVLEQPWLTFSAGSTPGTSTAVIAAAGYSAEQSLHLSYSTAMAGGALLAAQPTATGPAGGTYQLVVDPTAIGGPRPPRYLTVILDHGGPATNYSQAYSVSMAIDHVRSSLLTQLSSSDSFALFYVHNNAVVQAGGAGWRPAVADSVLATLATLPATPTADPARLEDLLKAALQHAAGRPSTTSSALALSYTTALSSQAAADTIFNRVASHLGGGFPTKVNVVTAAGNAYLPAFDPFWAKLALASGGVRYRHTLTSAQSLNGGPGQQFTVAYFYELPVRTILKNIIRNVGYNTPSYDVAAAVNGGFFYGWYDLNGPGRWSEHSVYAEVGRYAGTLSAAGGVAVQYMSPTGLVTGTVPVTIQPTGADTLMREAWTYNYITDLLRLNNTAYQAECIDSSIRARVLCPVTAFLALETGDTVGVSQPGNGTTTGIAGPAAPGAAAVEEAWLVASPNPFSDAVSIAFREEPAAVEIFDATGRRVWWGRATGKRLRWDGTDATGRALPPGLYVLRAHFADRVATLKLQKQ